MSLTISETSTPINWSEAQLVKGTNGEIVLVEKNSFNDSVTPNTFEGYVLVHPTTPTLVGVIQTLQTPNFDKYFGEVCLEQS